ncbi:hypothetical protein MRX96_032584 [Rhipicephalus microplus]
MTSEENDLEAGSSNKRDRGLSAPTLRLHVVALLALVGSGLTPDVCKLLRETPDGQSMIAKEIPATPGAPGTPFQAPPGPAAPFQAPPVQFTPFQAQDAPVDLYQAPLVGYGYEPPLEEAAPPTRSRAMDEATVRKLTVTTMALLLLVSAVVALLLVYIMFTPIEESFVSGTLSEVPLDKDDTRPKPSTGHFGSNSSSSNNR